VALLLVKVTLAPLLVVASSLAGRRWGPSVTGLLVALPIVAGPVLLIVDLEQGGRFAARAATAALLGLAALAAFVVVFAQAARVGGWPPALIAGWAAFISLALALSRVTLATGAAFALALSAFAVAALLLPRASGAGRAPTSVVLPAWDLPARALATAILVVCLTGAASGLGATLTGVLTPFPVAMSVLVAFVLAQEGRSGTNELLRGFLLGAAGFAVFCLLVAVLLVPVGPAGAFALALLGALAAQALTRAVVRERARVRPVAA